MKPWWENQRGGAFTWPSVVLLLLEPKLVFYTKFNIKIEIMLQGWENRKSGKYLALGPSNIANGPCDKNAWLKVTLGLEPSTAGNS